MPIPYSVHTQVQTKVLYGQVKADFRKILSKAKESKAEELRRE